jgi:hypothetical protein
MQMSGNSTHQVTNVWIRTNSTVSGMYVQRFVITVVIKYIFAATEIGKDQRLINIPQYISLTTFSTPKM